MGSSQQLNQTQTEKKELEETLTFRESCPECVAAGKICATLQGEDVC